LIPTLVISRCSVAFAQILSTVAFLDRSAGWQLLQELSQYLGAPDLQVLDGSLYALSLIFEDNAIRSQLLADEAGQRFLHAIMPQLINLFVHPEVNIRKFSLNAVNKFLYDPPEALRDNFFLFDYLRNVFKLTHDQNKEIRQKVCYVFVVLVEKNCTHLINDMVNVTEFMLRATQDDADDVALTACDFWQVYCESAIFRDCKEVLLNALPRLVPVLLKCMKYDDSDMALLQAGDDNNDTVPDRKEDIRPDRFHHSELKGENGEDEGNGDEDEATSWTLRKCAALAMDILAQTYREPLFKILVEHLKTSLNESDWKVREAAILALGAVSQGCYESVEPHLPELYPYLLQQADNPHALVRSITCWTVSRYFKWLVNLPDQEQLFQNLLSMMMRGILDQNKKVQEVACSSFALLEQVAGSRLEPYVAAIVPNLMHAFGRYQARNMSILCDALGCLAEAVGERLVVHIESLLPPLMGRWAHFAPDDKGLLPLLECLCSMTQALGHAFRDYAPEVFRRCLNIIKNTLFYQQRAPHADPPDTDFMVTALDLLSGLTDGMESSIESLVQESIVGGSNILQLLFHCMQHDVPDVRQSAFALLGDLAKSCIGHIRPYLSDFLPIAARNLSPKHSSVCNNASWAIGEIATKVEGQIGPYIPILLNALIPIINLRGQLSLGQNPAITMGRLGLACPHIVAPQLEQFARCWCECLSNIRDFTEKTHAFQGLCKVIVLNPQGILPHFSAMCKAFKWPDCSKDMHQLFYDILHSFKQQLGENWPHYFNSVDSETQLYLGTLYRL